MTLSNDVELSNTRVKLARLEERYIALQHGTAEDEHIRELSRRSLKKYINKFKEEIVRYEIRRTAQR